MAINIKFDLIGNPEPPTIILANRNGNILGQLKVDTKSIDLSDKFNDASEFSFKLNKYIDGKLTHLWDKVVDFKLVYCKEWECWFEIKVELDEKTETFKTVFCTQLGQAELSQIMLYNIEINTDADIERDDYKISILYDANDPEASILNRLLKDKAPHYHIAYVSPTIAKIQRSFSFDDTSILDAFQEIAEEIGCVFLYYASKDGDGILRREIAVHDLQQYCNDCGHRGEFIYECPKCGGKNIINGYGEDTLIFVTSDELASEEIQLVTDTDSVKNCFKLEAGDDLMTATVRNCNPNGTDYIWYFSDNIKEDMTKELVEKLNSYNKIYKEYYNEYTSEVNNSLVENYNILVDKYSVYNEDLQKITSPITGYPSLMNSYYNVIDLELYLKSGLMPSVEMSDTNAKEQVDLLTTSSLSPVAVADVTVASLATINSAVLAMAKTIVRPTYKVQIGSSELVDGGNSRSWKGNFVITNYSDDEDTIIGDIISVAINDDLEEFAKQKIEKALKKEDTDNLSISGLFEKEYDDFCNELKKYALTPLTSFHDACQSCIDILIDQGVADGDSWSDYEEGSDANLYEKLYLPYYNKLKAIESEIKVRESEINVLSGVYDTDGNLIADGLRVEIEMCKNKIQDALNFEDYLGEKLWLEFCAYRREDKYSNENYISDGLNNAELFKKALEFFEVAENEIYKSAELQHSISATLNNLLAIDKFKSLVKSFNVGNWIRVRVDDKIFKLRLLEYNISYDDFNNINVEFSDVTKIKNGTTDVQDILSQASSMATSYSSVQRQANQGDRAKNTLEQWISDGLNSAYVHIQSNDTEDITLTKNGLLCRSYDDITNTYSPEQLKITHNIMAYTDDDWKTVRQAIGKHEYALYDKNANKFVDSIGYGMNADFVVAGVVSGSQIIGGDVYSDNYSISDKTGSYLNLRDGTFNFGGGKITFNGTELLINPDNDIGVSEFDVTRIANGLISTAEIDAGQITTGQLSANRINTVGLIAENISAKTIVGKDISGGSLLIGDTSADYAQITNEGVLNCYGANITGKIIATEGVIGGCQIDDEGNLQIKNINIADKLTAEYIDATNLKVNAANVEGKLTAENIDATNLKVNAANVEGKLTAAEISAGKITAGKNDADITFDGTFTAPNAIITGAITATTGAIGGWNIFSNGLLGSAYYDDSKRSYYGIAIDARKEAFPHKDSDYHASKVFAIGQLGVPNVDSGAYSESDAISGAWGNASFYITADGHVTANRITVGDGAFSYGLNDIVGNISFATFTKHNFTWTYALGGYRVEVDANSISVTKVSSGESRSKSWWELLE